MTLNDGKDSFDGNLYAALVRCMREAHLWGTLEVRHNFSAARAHFKYAYTPREGKHLVAEVEVADMVLVSLTELELAKKVVEEIQENLGDYKSKSWYALERLKGGPDKDPCVLLGEKL